MTDEAAYGAVKIICYLNRLMKMQFSLCVLSVFLIGTTSVFAQKPEHQISFARESKPHSYYVKQAELWSKELAKDSTSEDSWYNFFRACRNAYGSANWKSDFINESPALRTGPDILQAMQRHIPNSFTYNYLTYLEGGIIPSQAPYLLKAYSMNPDFEGICSSMVSYAISINNDSLRKAVNKNWYPKNEIASGLLMYAYNVLMSVDSNGILFTQSDNDTYPLYMLQDALGIRTDVTVINIDFLLIDSYRTAFFTKMDIPPLEITANPDIYESNWEKVLGQCLKFYKKKAPLYLAMTLNQPLYQAYEKNLTVSGLTYRFAATPPDLTLWNNHLYTNVFLLDTIRHPLVVEQNQANVDRQNLNYIDFFKTVYGDSLRSKRTVQAQEVKDLAITLVARMGHPDWDQQVKNEFK